MMDNFDRSLSLVLIHEGGFSNNPLDPGGATMKGVTLETFRRMFGANQTVTDLQNITPKLLSVVYRSGYWDKCKGDKLPVGLDYAVFDTAVNSGPSRAGKFLQAALGVAQDGFFDKDTLTAVAITTAKNQTPKMINAVCDQRLTFLQALGTFSTFGVGWTKRVGNVRQQALKMANGSFNGLTPATIAAIQISVIPPVDFLITRLGSHGPWVVTLQNALKINADGQFGPTTEAAVRALQLECGLLVDGIAGRSTCRALGLLA